MAHLTLDRTIVRANPSAAGASKVDSGHASQALGWSRGGFSTKTHLSAAALGNRLRYPLTRSDAHDMTQAQGRSAGFKSA